MQNIHEAQRTLLLANCRLDNWRLRKIKERVPQGFDKNGNTVLCKQAKIVSKEMFFGLNKNSRYSLPTPDIWQVVSKSEDKKKNQN